MREVRLLSLHRLRARVGARPIPSPLWYLSLKGSNHNKKEGDSFFICSCVPLAFFSAVPVAYSTTACSNLLPQKLAFYTKDYAMPLLQAILHQTTRENFGRDWVGLPLWLYCGTRRDGQCSRPTCVLGMFA